MTPEEKVQKIYESQLNGNATTMDEQLDELIEELPVLDGIFR